MSEAVHAGGHEIDVGRPEKVLFPDDGITKADLVSYYLRIAGTMLPYVRGRPVAMRRFPDGIEEDGFFEKEAPAHFPEWIRRVTVEKEDGRVTHVVIEHARDLGYLAEQACITPHVWLSRSDAPASPDRMIFDLDPSRDDDFESVCAAARALRERLESLELVPFVMTTGSRGLHVVVPLARGPGFDEVRDVAEAIARETAEADPQRLTVETLKRKRRGRVFVDWLRNAYGQHAAPAYAVRPLRGAPVATPLDWDEVGAGLSPRRYTVRNLFRRLGAKEDPWRGMGRHGRSLARARKELGLE